MHHGVLTWGAAILHLVLRGRQFATNKQVVAEFYRAIYDLRMMMSGNPANVQRLLHLPEMP